MGMGLAVICAVGMATARAGRGGERLQGNIEARGDSLRILVYPEPGPVTGIPVSLREPVHGTDDAARRTARRTLNRHPRRSPWATSSTSVVVAEHEDNTREI